MVEEMIPHVDILDVTVHSDGKPLTKVSSPKTKDKKNHHQHQDKNNKHGVF